MNKLPGIILLLVLFNNVTAQNKDLDSLTILKDASSSVCKCVDSIVVGTKSHSVISKDVKSCLDKQIPFLLISRKVMNTLKGGITGDKEIEVTIDEKNKDYELVYYELERYTLENCKALRKIASVREDDSVHANTFNDDARKAYNEGLKYSRVDEYEKAIPYFRNAVRLDAEFLAWDNLGRGYRAVNKYDSALYAYKKSLKINPAGAMPLQNIPVVYEYMKEYRKAVDAYHEIIKYRPKDPEAFYGLGRMYAFFLDDLEKGLDYTCKAYNIYIEMHSPYRSDAEANINNIYKEMKKNDKEKRFYEILKTNNINAD